MRRAPAIDAIKVLIVTSEAINSNQQQSAARGSNQQQPTCSLGAATGPWGRAPESTGSPGMPTGIAFLSSSPAAITPRAKPTSLAASRARTICTLLYLARAATQCASSCSFRRQRVWTLRTTLKRAEKRPAVKRSRWFGVNWRRTQSGPGILSSSWPGLACSSADTSRISEATETILDAYEMASTEWRRSCALSPTSSCRYSAISSQNDANLSPSGPFK
eukprot:7391980-Prymnesium_polylepis.1